ncbi:hypothetical protein ACIQM0_03480 [Streptomyces sp. NPDC091387]
MICARCDQPMRPEDSESYDIPGATGPGITILVHKVLCEIPAEQRR